jgi:signal transduction histidine kinase
MASAAPVILLVEANTGDRTLITLLLQRELPDLVVRVASTAVEFAEVLGNDRFDALICDSALPWANPEEVAEAMRRRHPHCALVLTAARADESFVRTTSRARSDACVVKDGEGMLALPRVLSDVLHRSRAHAGATLESGVIESLPLGIVLVNVRGKVLRANPAADRLLGREDHGLAGEHLPSAVDSGSLRALWDRRRDLNGGVEGVIEVSGRRLKASLRAMQDTEGGLGGYELLVEPAQSGAELALASQAERLRRANEELEQLTYALSHDLQEPLQLVARHLRRLSDRQVDRLDDDGQRALGHAARGVERMQGMLDSILAYSRVGAYNGPREEIDLDRLLDETVIDLGALIEEHSADLSHSQLPTLRVSRREMSQLFHNLITNAIKFRRGEPPKIDVRVEERASDWLFSVADNGIGIDGDGADRIFGMFQRLHTEEEIPGTGVGLALCKRIVEHHGGRIWMRSEPGRGTTFYFTLPKPDQSQRGAAATAHAEQRLRR